MEEEPAPNPAANGRTRPEHGASDASAVTACSDAARTSTPDRSSESDELRGPIVEALRTLPTQSKLVLLAVLDRDRRGAACASTGEVYNAYAALCADAPVDPLSQRRVTDLLGELDTFGLVSAVVISRGRYGRTREIEGAIAAAPARAVLLADERLGDVATTRGHIDGE